MRENQKNSKAKLKQLEQQLLQINQRHNHALSVVRKLKEEVNQVRRERVIFDSVFKKLEQDLKCKDEELMSSLAQTIKHEKTRDEILEELRVIRALYGEQKQSMLERIFVIVEFEETFESQLCDYRKSIVLLDQQPVSEARTNFLTQPEIKELPATQVQRISTEMSDVYFQEVRAFK